MLLALRGTSFEGTSGLVNFSSSLDRDPAGVPFAFANLIAGPACPSSHSSACYRHVSARVVQTLAADAPLVQLADIAWKGPTAPVDLLGIGCL